MNTLTTDNLYAWLRLCNTQSMHLVSCLIFPCAMQEDYRPTVYMNILYMVSINNSNFENEQNINNTCTSTFY